MDASQISNEALGKAIHDAIVKSKLFSRIVEDGPDFDLAVTLFRVQQPAMGFSMTVNMEAGWVLTRTATKQLVWRESIESDYTASTSAHLVGVERLRIATEGAARRNIRRGLEKIATLPLSGQADPGGAGRPATSP